MAYNFKQFDEEQNNMMGITDYEDSSYRKGGAVSGIIPSNIHNRLFYQTSTMVTAIAKALSDKGYTVNDTTLAGLVTVMSGLVTDIEWPSVYQTDFNVTDTAALNYLKGRPELMALINGASVAPVPVGAIFPFPADNNNLPPGYDECNGARKDKTASSGLYLPLFNVIGYRYGGSGNYFHVPDYRGLFLRGWDHASSPAVDPDRSTRTDSKVAGASGGGGYAGDSVGSKQTDELLEHTHTFSTTNDNTASYTTPLHGGSPVMGTVTPALFGGNETRPINVNVMYIIKIVFACVCILPSVISYL